MMNEKVTYVSALSYVLSNCSLPIEIAEKLTALKNQTEKRNTAERKPTAKQRAAAEASAEIAVWVRNALAASGKPLTVKEIIEAAGLHEYSTQKVSAVLKAMGAEVVRTVEKRTAYYSLAE